MHQAPRVDHAATYPAPSNQRRRKQLFTPQHPVTAASSTRESNPKQRNITPCWSQTRPDFSKFQRGAQRHHDTDIVTIIDNVFRENLTGIRPGLRRRSYYESDLPDENITHEARPIATQLTPLPLFGASPRHRDTKTINNVGRLLFGNRADAMPH